MRRRLQEVLGVVSSEQRTVCAAGTAAMTR